MTRKQRKKQAQQIYYKKLQEEEKKRDDKKLSKKNKMAAKRKREAEEMREMDREHEDDPGKEEQVNEIEMDDATEKTIRRRRMLKLKKKHRAVADAVKGEITQSDKVEHNESSAPEQHLTAGQSVNNFAQNLKKKKRVSY